MINNSLHYLLALVFVLFLQCAPIKKDILRIATAANMQFAMPELVAAYQQQSGQDCEIILSSSGKLTAQIKAGAPFDVFVSADMKYPQLLFTADLTTSQPVVYAYGKLVLWTTKHSQSPNFEYLFSPKTAKIALPNPQIAPYGRAAREVLHFNDTTRILDSKLVFGESIAQTNQFITTGAVDYGFTAKSVVLSSQLPVQGLWQELDNDQYQPIEQGVVVLKSSKLLSQATAFKTFLLSPIAKEILDTFGYE